MTAGLGMEMPIMHDSDRYDFVRDIGSGNFGVARLMRDKVTQELVAVKYIERGDKVSCQISIWTHSAASSIVLFCNDFCYPSIKNQCAVGIDGL